MICGDVKLGGRDQAAVRWELPVLRSDEAVGPFVWRLRRESSGKLDKLGLAVERIASDDQAQSTGERLRDDVQ